MDIKKCEEVLEILHTVKYKPYLVITVQTIQLSIIHFFLNILFNIFSTYNHIMSTANLTSIPKVSSINPITIINT